MDPESLLEQLQLLADKLGIEVRSEPLDGPGGLCVVKGAQVLFVDSEAPVEEQAHVMCRALAKQDLGGVFIVPEVRDVLERYQKG